MMVIEMTPVAEAALPVARLKEHLRLASGFTADQLQDSLLAGFLRAALAAIESRTGKALMARDFEWTLGKWRDGCAEVMPMAPVSAITQVAQIDKTGAATVVASGQYRLEPDAQAPRLVGEALPGIPAGGQIRVRFTAGYGATFDSLPADLAQAVMLLASHYYEYRQETALGAGCMPFGVTALIERYRPMRLSLGAAQ